MSSSYRAICLSHTPALVVEEPEWQTMDVALAGFAAGVPGHSSCDLLLGRYSYPLVEVCCPRGHGGGIHHHSDRWVDASWLRLMLLAGPEAAKTARVSGCWTFDRVDRLRAELLDEPPAARPELTAKTVYEKYAALPPRCRSTARWVMSRDTFEALCAAVGQPKPPSTGAARLLDLPVAFDEAATGMRLLVPAETVVRWS